MRVSMLIGLTLVTLQGCAHHHDVRPGQDGINWVSFKTESKNDGYAAAMSQAEDYCKQYNKRPVHLSESSAYIGSMDEKTYNAIKTGSKIAQAGGFAVGVAGGKRERGVGMATGVGGATVDSMIDDGYEFSMRFKCVE